MSSRFRLKSVLVSGISLGALVAASAVAAPLAFTTPNVIATAGATSVTLNGQTFVNQGLQGVARLSATTTKDFNGDTFGAFSSLDVLPGTWRKNADGSYSGTLFSLPDRGPNGLGSISFSDYPGRVSTFDMNFTPYTSSTNLPVSEASQHQLKLTQTGGFFFKDFNGNTTTGLDASTTITENGKVLPGASNGKISLDAEGLRFLANGNFYVSDEYGANVYYFNSAGQMLGVIQPPPALVPRDAGGNLFYTSLTDSTTGRRFNQGLEGMAVTPDQKKLVTLLQSATEQDSNTNQQTRTNTRLMIYDISQTNSPTAPVADYVVQLPVYTLAGNGAAPNRTAAQSEILALNDTQFLMLSRDALGLGLTTGNSVVKSIMLIDTTGATNIAGTAFETGNTPISPAGVLNSSITPVTQVEVVNMLNSTQLGKFGINLNNTSPTGLTLGEKWEGMALVPVLDEAAPNDYFLLVGNDNDFLSTTCNVGGQNCAQGVNSDAVVLTYRLTLPTYVDPQYLGSLNQTGGATLGMTSLAAHDLVVATGRDLSQHLEILRHNDGILPAQSADMDLSAWAAGNWASRAESSLTTRARTGGATVGVDARLDETVTLGVALGYYLGDSGAAGGFSEDYNALQLTAYGAFNMDGFYGNLAATWSDLDFSNIARPSAYGLTANGKTGGSGTTVSGELGYLMYGDDGMRVGPLGGFRYTNTSIDAYTETGAVGGNIIFPKISSDGVSGFFGGEISMPIGEVRPIFRLTYNTKDDFGASNAILSLASTTAAMGTATVALPGLAQDYIEPSLTLTSSGNSAVKWWLGYGAKIGLDDGIEHHLTAGFKVPL